MGTLLEFVNDARARRGAAVMAVINTTPDSFFDGGRYVHHDAARRRIDEVLEDGADLIDIGAESTRPGSLPIYPHEQLERAAWAIEYAVSCDACVSIDTTSVEVAREALRLGARVINDVSCLGDPELADVAKENDADLIIMHSRGSMTTMDGFSKYDSKAYDEIVSDVRKEWEESYRAAVDRGVAEDRIWFDPGLGFHKSAAHSHELMSRLDELCDLGAGLVLGASRKSFLGALDDSPPEGRLGASIAACLRGVDAGAKIVRVHDVAPVVQALIAHEKWQSKAESMRLARGVPLVESKQAVESEHAAENAAENASEIEVAPTREATIDA